MEKRLYVDSISWTVFFKILASSYSSIYVLDTFKRFSVFKLKILAFFGNKVNELDFFTGDLFHKNEDEAVYIKASKLTSDLSLNFASQVLDSDSMLYRINQLYGDNSLKLHFAKYFQINLFQSILRIKTFEALAKSNNDTLLLDAPFFFSDKLESVFCELKIRFYNKKLNRISSTLNLLLKEIFIRLRKYYPTAKNDKKKIDFIKFPKGVLSIQEESIRKDQSLRGHFHWADLNEWQSYPLHTLSLNHGSSKLVKDLKDLEANNFYLHKEEVFLKAKKNINFNPEIHTFKKEIHRLWGSVFKISRPHLIFTIKAMFLMYRAVDIASLCLYLNVKVYVVKEPYFVYSDAIQLLAKKINITTLAYQYSNLGYTSPLMTLSSDVFLIFSNAYKNVFKVGDITANEYKVMGYVTEGVQPKLTKRIKKLKSKLESKGVTFTIAYFDESNQKNRWGLIKEEEYYQHIISFANMVLDDKSLAIIVKTQFNINSIGEKFKNNDTVKKAIKSGRLIEVFKGEKRNDVYPVEVALVSDICINDMIGATAGLEAVNSSRRCILLNKYNYKTIHHSSYLNGNIIYKDISSALNAIKVHRQKIDSGIESDLGDWSKIKNYFLGNDKIAGINKIRREVEIALEKYNA